MGQTIRSGIDVACKADHQASCAGAAGEFLWSGWRFKTTSADLERLWAKLPEGADITVVLEPTRNAWVPLAAWLRARGAKVVMVPPEQSADLRDYYNKHTKTTTSTSASWPACRCCTPTDCARSIISARPSPCCGQ